MDTSKRPRLDDGDAEGDVVIVDANSRPFPQPEPEHYKMQNRPAFTSAHKIQKFGSKYHLLIGITGSVASIKLKELTDEIRKQAGSERIAIKVVATRSALHFVNFEEITDVIYEDRDEWGMWTKRGDPVLHIELRKWADAMVIAPLDANTLAKIANGQCDNLLTCIVRAWDCEKPLHFAPAMNTCMYNHPLTYKHVNALKEMFQYKEIPAIEKELMCGDRGYGAMANVKMIASIIASDVRNRFAVYSNSN